MDQFLVEIFLPEMTADFVSLIPEQRTYISNCMTKGSIQSYSLSMDRSKLWVIFNTRSEPEMERLLQRFPIFEWISYEAYPLMMHQTMEMRMPAISLN
jgi:hypothetical protein